MQDGDGNGAEAGFAPDFLHEAVDVEVGLVKVLQFFLVSVDLVEYGAEARRGGSLRDLVRLFLAVHILQVVVSDFLHVDAGELAEPASGDFALLFGGGQV